MPSDPMMMGGGGASGLDEAPRSAPGMGGTAVSDPVVYPAWWPDRQKKKGKPIDDTAGGMTEIARDYPGALRHWMNANADIIKTAVDATRHPPTSREMALDRIDAISRLPDAHATASESQRLWNLSFLNNMLTSAPQVGEEDEQVYDLRVTTARRALSAVRRLDARPR